jgi:tetratricopeptide (TPR) repeat protein
LEFLDRSLSTNASNTKALNLKAVVLRKMGRFAEAEKMASAALAVDPLDLWAQRELMKARKEKPRQIYFAPDFWNDDSQLYLEMAVSMANAGLWEEGLSVLEELAGACPDKSRTNPMVYYWLGYMNEKAGKEQEAMRNYELASKMPSEYCFPFRVESIDVFNHAMEKNPRDARAPYYLGNLLYDRQPMEAIKAWERARRLDDKLAMVHRNLADAYAWTEGDYRKAIDSLEIAVSLQPHPKFLSELDELFERAGVSPQKRLENLEKHQQAVLERDDVLTREIRLYVQLGNYDKALELLLSGHHFTVWEGGRIYSAHASYQDANLLKGHQYLRARKYKEALKHYEAALEYPENFSTGRPRDGGRAPVINYFMGTAYEALGDANMATEFFEKSAAAPSTAFTASRSTRSYAPEILFYRGCSLRKLGRANEAARIFDSLIKSGHEVLRSSGTERPDYFAKFGERETKQALLAQGHYVLGLGYLGSGRRHEAKAELGKAIKLNVNHMEAQYQLAALVE